MTPFLAVPTRGTIGWATVTRLEEIKARFPDSPPILYQPGNLSVAQTRNRIVAKFMESDCDVLVMVDDDVVPSPHWLSEILPPMDEYGVIALPHPMPDPLDRSQLRLTVFDWTDDGWRFRSELEQGLHECDAVATGCVAVHRDVLHELGENPFHIGGEAWGESDDYWFCRDARDAGVRIAYFYDGWYADHHTVVSLAPLYEATMLERSTR